MVKDNKYYNFFICSILVIFSFCINFYVGSNGVFPVDTFIHYDNGYRILLGDAPVKDYWIVHGFLIDYIQAIFFKTLGNNWYSYLIHSSMFNVAITISSYFIFRLLKINIYFTIILSISVAFLAYPVSGTPFLDLHSTFFTLFAVYFLIFAIEKERDINWLYASIFLCLAFFSKQVPAAYTIIGLSFINIYISLNKKKISIFFLYSAGAIVFLITLFLFLNIEKIPFQDFILQLFLFPPSIGTSRYDLYELSFKNIILDYKFIHIVFLPIIIINILNLVKTKSYYQSKNFQFFLLLFVLVFSTLFHQIYTKNQIYIFSLLPILMGFLLYYINFNTYKFRIYISYLVIALCIFTTAKYHFRFNMDRKFHELNNVSISNSIKATSIDQKLSGLNWISPYFENPQEEIDLIKTLLTMLEKDNTNVMLISQYNFFSSLIDKKLYSPSRTYDSISYPRKNTKYFKNYQNHLINIIKKNNISKIYIFEEISKVNMNEKVFNYISKNCFNEIILNKHLAILHIKKCPELK
jgi:hypothetical protein